jgi:hypothetical protein
MTHDARVYGIRPTYGGWQLCTDGERRATFGDWRDALACAELMATWLHDLAGITTSVVMDMNGRDVVEVAHHG